MEETKIEKKLTENLEYDKQLLENDIKIMKAVNKTREDVELALRQISSCFQRLAKLEGNHEAIYGESKKC